MEPYFLYGKQFNEKFNECKMVKLTNTNENHNHYQFKTGLNVDHLPFKPKGECQAGGIYFCSFDKLNQWLHYSERPMFYIRLVTIPEDAFVWVENDKFKADQLILSDRQLISDLDIWSDPLYCLKSWQLSQLSFKYFKQQTLEMCLLSVKRQVEMLMYVKEQTPEICLAAVLEYGEALKYVGTQTPEICLVAVLQCGTALKYVNTQTPEICLAAVSEYGKALEYVKEQTPKICLAAVSEYGGALKYVKEQTEEICLAAIRTNYHAVQHVKENTPKIRDLFTEMWVKYAKNMQNASYMNCK